MRLMLGIAACAVAVASLSGQTAKPTSQCSVLAQRFVVTGQVQTRWWLPDGGWALSTKTLKDPVKVSWILGYLSAAGVSGKAAEPGGEATLSGGCLARARINQDSPSQRSSRRLVGARVKKTTNR